MENVPQSGVMTYSGDAGERKCRTQPWLKAYYCGNLGTHALMDLMKWEQMQRRTRVRHFSTASRALIRRKKQRRPRWCAQSTNQLALTTASSTVFMISIKTFLLLAIGKDAEIASASSRKKQKQKKLCSCFALCLKLLKEEVWTSSMPQPEFSSSQARLYKHFKLEEASKYILFLIVFILMNN